MRLANTTRTAESRTRGVTQDRLFRAILSFRVRFFACSKETGKAVRLVQSAKKLLPLHQKQHGFGRKFEPKAVPPQTDKPAFNAICDSLESLFMKLRILEVSSNKRVEATQNKAGCTP